MSSKFFKILSENTGKKAKARVVIPMAQDEACAYAVIRGVKSGIMKAVLIGDAKEISNFYGEIIKSEDVNVVSETDPNSACKIAVQMISSGKADLLMKGLVSTSSFLKSVLGSQDGLKKAPLLSHLTFFELKNIPGLKLLSDVAINISPDEDTLEKIVKNALEAFKLIEKKQPKVALLSANEKVSEKVLSTVLAKKVSEKFSGSDQIVEGPISLDLAICPESAKIKKYQGKIQGDANIFIVPRIEVGNVLYKSLQHFAEADMGGVVFGAKCPVVLTSRSDSNDTKFYSLLLGINLWENGRN
ncbi:MAG: phosphate butyryltransferase [Candidatus Riflebacteria bacterium]|nr:phosphate butyryltransferase [Candidatus Riflebacteria bacterium]